MITNTTGTMVAKTAAFVAGLALVLTSFAPSASAQTSASLQAQIQALLAQIAALQTQMNGGAPVAAFTRDLTIGSQGGDVTSLQNWLIKNGYGIPAGATGYFGAQTQAALARYQAASSISPAAGYFGPLTRARVNASIVVTPTPDTDDEDDSDNDDDNDNDNDDELEGGAGDLESANYTSGLSNEDVGEGDSDVEVAGLDLEADDNSDIALTAVRVSIEATDDNGQSSEDFEDYADSLSLWFDGDEIGSVDADDLRETRGEYTHTFSIDRNDAIIRSGDEGQLTLSVSALRNIDSRDLADNTFTVYFEVVRYTDAQGAVISEDNFDDIGDSSDAEGREFEFTTFAQANDVELTIDEADSSPRERTTEIDRDNKKVLLAVGELSADGSDIEIHELSFNLDSSTTGFSTTTNASSIINTVSEFLLMVDGDEIDSIDSDEFNGANATGSNASSTLRYTFGDIDEEDFTVEEGESLEFEIWAVVNELEDGQSLSLEVSVGDEDIEAEAEGEELEASEGEIDGTVDGDEQTFRSEGLAVTVDRDDSTTRQNNNNTQFVFELDIAAFGEDEDLDISNFNFTVSRNGTTTGISVNPSERLRSRDFDDNGGTLVEVDENEGRVTYTVTIFADSVDDNGVYTVTLTDITTDDGEVTLLNESMSEALTFSG